MRLVLRLRSRAPRRASSSATCLLTVGCEMPLSRAAAEKLCVSTTRAKRLMLLKRSIAATPFILRRNEAYAIDAYFQNLPNNRSIAGARAGPHQAGLIRSEETIMSQGTLAAALDAFRAEWIAAAPAGRAALYDAKVRELQDSGILDRALGVGDLAPDFALPEA